MSGIGRPPSHPSRDPGGGGLDEVLSRIGYLDGLSAGEDLSPEGEDVITTPPGTPLAAGAEAARNPPLLLPTDEDDQEPAAAGAGTGADAGAGTGAGAADG